MQSQVSAYLSKAYAHLHVDRYSVATLTSASSRYFVETNTMSRRKPRRKRNGRRRRMVRQDKQILTEFTVVAGGGWLWGRKGRKGHCVATRRVCSRLSFCRFPPHSRVARQRWRRGTRVLAAVTVSRRRKQGTGLLLSRVCKTASGNTVCR